MKGGENKMKQAIIDGNVRRHIEVPRAKAKVGNCLLCNRPDQGTYTPSRKNEFLCSVCTMLLAGQSQELLKLMHDATDINRQKTALSMFIIPEGKDGIKPVRRNNDRKRTTRSIRNKKSDARQSETKQKISVL